MGFLTKHAFQYKCIVCGCGDSSQNDAPSFDTSSTCHGVVFIFNWTQDKLAVTLTSTKNTVNSSCNIVVFSP